MVGVVTIAFVQTYALYNMGLQFGWHCPERYSRLPFAQPYSTVPLNPAGTAWFGLGHCTVDRVSWSIFGTRTFDPV